VHRRGLRRRHRPRPAGPARSEELGLDLRKETPSALFGLLLFSVLLSARLVAALIRTSLADDACEISGARDS